MTIQVKFFASLREQVGHGDMQIEAAQVATVDDVWQQATDQMAMPDNTLCAVNMEYVAPEQAVKDGDEVAFFPPVTGG